jgi:uncharacterized protein YaaQ
MQSRAEEQKPGGGAVLAARPTHHRPDRAHRRRAPQVAPPTGGGGGDAGVKLLIVIVSDPDADGLLRAMVERGFSATKIGSTGGFLRRGNTTLLSGVAADQVDEVIELVRDLCPVRTELLAINSIPLAGEMPFLTEPVEVRAGGAVIFVLPVARFERI